MKKSKPQKPTPATAFARASAGYELFGKKLLPFSSMRQAAASTMGLRFGMVDPNDIFSITIEDVKQGRKTSEEVQTYNQLYADVVKVIWLCFVPDSRVLRAERKRDEAVIEAFKWADAQGISITSSKYYEAANVFFLMMGDIAVSTGTPKREGEDEKRSDDDDDEAGND